jgi:hypothetical protein
MKLLAGLLGEAPWSSRRTPEALITTDRPGCSSTGAETAPRRRESVTCVQRLALGCFFA